MVRFYRTGIGRMRGALQSQISNLKSQRGVAAQLRGQRDSKTPVSDRRFCFVVAPGRPVSILTRVANNKSSRTHEKGVQELDGQKLLRLSQHSRGLHSTFEFDLGGVLITRPYDQKSEQWMLFEPSGFVLTLRGDKRFSYHRSNELCDADSWKSI